MIFSFFILSQPNFPPLHNFPLVANMTKIVHFTTHVKTVSVLIPVSLGILAVEMRIVKSSITSLFAPARTVTPEPRVPRTWTSVWKTQTSATMASVETSREALSASAGPATPGPSAITSLTSVSPTLVW